MSKQMKLLRRKKQIDPILEGRLQELEYLFSIARPLSPAEQRRGTLFMMFCYIAQVVLSLATLWFGY